MKVLNFQVEIGAGGPQGYEVTLRGPDGAETAALSKLPLRPDELRRLAARVPDAVLSSSAQLRRTVSAEERPVQELGRLLFDALLPGDGRALFAAARHRATQEERQLRMVLRVRPPELAGLPWEFLYDDGQGSYVCPTTPLVRHPQVAAPQRPLRVAPPLRVLCMAARPDDLEPLALSTERQRLHSALAGLEQEGLIELGWTAGETWRDLRTALRRTGEGQWHVFHFIGHGGFDATAQEGTLALADEEGGTYHLGAENLTMVLEGMPSLRLVVLNACETGRSSALDPFSSVAGALMRRGVPAALAMQFPISDRAAVEFSRTFYEGLAHRLPVDAAVTEARQAIRLTLPGTLEWGTPVLYMRSLDGLLFDLRDSPRAEAREQAQADSRELHDLYVQGLAALYTRRWDDAVAAFRAVVAQDGTYKDSRARLAEVLRSRRLEALFAAGTGAAEFGHWAAAVEHLEAVVAAEPGYRDAGRRLEEARQQLARTALRAEIADLHSAGQWEAVLAVGERLARLSPQDADPDGLVTRAARELGAVASDRETGEEKPSTRHGEQDEAQAPDVDAQATVVMPGSVPVEPPDRNLLPGVGDEPARWVRGFEPEPGQVRGAPARPGASRAEDSRRAGGARAEPATKPDEPVRPPQQQPRPERKPQPQQKSQPQPQPQLQPQPQQKPQAAPGGSGSRPQDVVLSEWPHPTAFAFSRDGSRVAVGYEGRRAVVADLGGNLLAHVRHPVAWQSTFAAAKRAGAPVTSVALTPDGNHLATAVGPVVRIWSVAREAELQQLKFDDEVRAMVFSPSGHRVVFATASGTAYVWNTRTASTQVRMDLGTCPYRMNCAPGGLRMVTAGPDGARVWNIASGERLAEIASGTEVLDAVFSPDGTTLATGGADSGAGIFDTRSGAEVLRLTGTGSVSRVAYDREGGRLLTVVGLTVRMWDTTTGEALAGHRYTPDWFVHAVAFGPDRQARALARTRDALWLRRVGDGARDAHWPSGTGGGGRDDAP
ncbi:CHAT domain-containing protein [Streptomyces phaeochromogenes]|uniref:CHAT domain-containing protein n=1 Tax=Streptomyces phaeochromogenes TaxID=1923 RepID=UPI0036B9179B